MLRNDWVLRQIEQAIRLLQMIAGLLDFRHYPEALDRIDEGYRLFFGLDSGSVGSLPLDYLLDMLRIHGRLDGTRVVLMAKLLRSEGEIYEAQEDEERSSQRSLRALQLLLAAYESGEESHFPGGWEDIDALAERLSRYDLPLSLKPQLLSYLEQTGHFAEAENLLWEWLAATDHAPTPVARGLAFYRRLLELPDEALERGELPRSEVEHALLELEGMGG